jgi:hypothetical protein
MNSMNIIERYNPLYCNVARSSATFPYMGTRNSLNMENKYRYCSLHCCCGKHVGIGDILLLMKLLKLSVGVSRLVVGAFKVDKTNGFATCFIGYLPRRYYDRYTIEVFDGLYLSVVFDDRSNSTSTATLLLLLESCQFNTTCTKYCRLNFGCFTRQM